MNYIKKLMASAGTGLGCALVVVASASASVPNNSVTSAKIVAGAVTASDLAANSVSASKIRDGAVGSSELGIDAVTNSKIASNAVSASNLRSDSVAAAEIAAGAVGSSELATDSVGADELQADSVEAGEIAAGAVGTSELATGGVASVDIADGTIAAADIAAGAVTASKLQAAAADLGAANVTVDLGNTNNTGSAWVTNVTTDGTLTATGGLATSGLVTLGAQAFTIADNGGGTAAAGTLTPTSSYVKVTCSDTDGCNVTMGEGSAVDGQVVVAVNIGANVANFADTATTSELTAALAAGQWDNLSLAYVTDRWVELARSNN